MLSRSPIFLNNFYKKFLCIPKCILSKYKNNFSNFIKFNSCDYSYFLHKIYPFHIKYSCKKFTNNMLSRNIILI